MKSALKKITPALAGILPGIISYCFLEGWYNTIPWSIAALIVGYLSKSRRSSIINGAIFGYFLFLVYIFAGYKGKTDAGSMIKFVLFDLLFSLVGAFAGVIGAFVGNWVREKFRGNNRA